MWPVCVPCPSNKEYYISQCYVDIRILGQVGGGNRCGGDTL